MDLLPLFLNIRGRLCVVVGGGELALRKASLLRRAGGRLRIVAPDISAELEVLAGEEGDELLRQPFDPAALDGAVLAIAATDDTRVNAAVSKAARAANIPVNVVDQPRLCSFIMPAIVDRSPVVIAISSGGSSPVLTRHLKAMNEVMVPGRINLLAELMGSRRGAVKKAIPEFSDRLRFWESVLDGDIPELIYSGANGEAERRLDEAIARAEPGAAKGEVYLVGAGPGDPDLLTLRALRLMHKADVVLYDRLVSPQILARVRPDAEKIHVGKERARHSVEQSRINEMLVEFAQQGKRVLRLKGGDPFIFGRGGEELATLAEQGIAFQVVPGITAASGCAAYAGIPLTHRDHAQSVRFLAGHLKDGSIDLEWEHLAIEQQTLVFYMGLVGLPTICDRLIEHGKPAETPAAIVQQGTTEEQRVITGSLQTLPGLAERAGLKAPTLIIVGEVVRLRDRLKWFEDRDSVEP